MKNKFVIIDGNAILHRAWHAMPPLMTKDGTIVSAAYGFTSMLLKVLKDIKPTHIAVTFDLPGGTFRHEAFEEYKAHRVEQPQELYDQIPMVEEVLEGFDIPVYTKEGYEADDVIGTLSKVAPKDTEVIIVTGDLDTLQLVDKRTKIYTSRKGLSDIVIYDEAAVKERYGLTPEQMIDYKSIRGDASDNIPGLRGIGEKGAISLLKEYKTVEGIYKALKKDPESFKPRTRTALENGEKNIPLSKELVTIVCDLKLDFSFKDTKFGEPDMEALQKTFQKYEFKNLMGRVEKQFSKEPKKEKKLKTVPVKKSTKKEIDFSKLSTVSYRITYNNDDRIDPSFSSVAIHDGKNTSVFKVENNKFSKDVAGVFSSKKITKIGHGIKQDLIAFYSVGLEVNGETKDIMVMSYLLNPGSRAHSFESLLFEETGKKKKKQESLFTEENDEELSNEAELVWDIHDKLADQLKDEELVKVFEDIDMPLVPVLADMERQGVLIDKDEIGKQEKKITKEVNRLLKKISKQIGEDVNINSPKQLSVALFEKLKLPTVGIKKTSTGFYSTAVGNLEKLKGTHAVIDDMLEYREVFKLLSTYIIPIPSLVHKKTGRLHARFNQVTTATGRLSSTDPNLQNIPIKTDIGKDIRKAFVAGKGFTLIAADYSQVELRIAASMADDKKMIDVFKRGEDIHTTTAAEIFEVDPKKVTPDQRRSAKAINFGILYGLGPNALANSTNLTFIEAKEFISKYLRVFRGLHNYMEDTKKLVKRNGWVETMFGRRRYLPEINSGVHFLVAEAERMAINMPIQGTQADIIKLAMIELHKKISKEYGLEADADVKLLMQVHDELVLEVKKGLVKKMSKVIKEIMEETVKLKVPVDVKVEIGQSWGEMKPVY